MSTVPILFSFPSAASSEQRGFSSSAAVSAIAQATLSDLITVTITALSSESNSPSSSFASATPTPTFTAVRASNSTSVPYPYKDNKFSRVDWALTIILGGGGIILCCMVPIVIAVYWKDWQAKRRERWGESSGEDF